MKFMFSQRHMVVFIAALLVCMVAVLLFPVWSLPFSRTHDADEQVRIIAEALQARDGIALSYEVALDPESQQGIHAAPASAYERLQGARWVREALALYPPGFIKDAARLTDIRLFHSLRLHQFRDKSGTVSGFTLPEGQAYFALGDGPLRIKSFFGWNAESRFKRMVHHELLHAADNAGDGVALDAAWYALGEYAEDPYIRTWDHQASPRDNVRARRSHWQNFFDLTPSGFVEVYGMADEAEDRASIAGLLMTNPQRLERMMRRDPLLQKKVAFIKGLYEERSRGMMGEAYWRDAIQGVVGTAYWAQSSNKDAK